jgi:coatomer subunit beta'
VCIPLTVLWLLWSRRYCVCTSDGVLVALESQIRSPGSTSESSKLLDVYPLELRFPLEPNKCTECPVTLTNRTDCYVGVWITPAKPHTCHGFYFSYLWWQFPSSSFFQIMDPHSTLVVTLVMDPLQLGLGLQDTEDKFQVLMIVMESQKDLENLNPSISSSTDNDMLRRVEELGGEVHRAILRAVSCDPASCKPEVVHSVPMVCVAPFHLQYLSTEHTKKLVIPF